MREQFRGPLILGKAAKTANFYAFGPDGLAHIRAYGNDASVEFASSDSYPFRSVVSGFGGTVRQPQGS
jgi:hypothetical protein